MHRKQRFSVLIVGAFALIIIIVIAVCVGRRNSVSSDEISQGVVYLQSLEAQDPDEVDKVLKEQRLQHIQEMRDERLRQLESGEISVWSLFEDYVLLGDSRAVGFSYYDFLPEDRVIAEGGATILDLQENIPNIVALNPSNVFLCYGLNDVSIGVWSTPEEYTTQFADIIAELQAQLPDVNIFISSILPARDPAFEQSEAWYNIPEYSDAVGVMCDNISHCYYVDNDETAEEYADLWDTDGIHVQKDFYPHWATNMIVEVYGVSLADSGLSGGNEESTDESSDVTDPAA